jgi:protein-tyrosine-phosphatase
MTASRIFFVFIFIFSLIFVVIPKVSAQISKTSVPESDFARDIRIGVEETRNNRSASSMQEMILDNEDISGKISTSQGVFDVDVIQSMDEDDLNQDVTTKEEQTDDMKAPSSPTIMMKGY